MGPAKVDVRINVLICPFDEHEMICEIRVIRNVVFYKIIDFMRRTVYIKGNL